MKEVTFLELEEDKNKFLKYISNIEKEFIFIDIIGNLNIVLFYLEDKIFVCGQKHIQMNCIFSKEELIDIISNLLEKRFVLIKNSKYIIKYINSISSLDHLLDMDVYFHFMDNRNYENDINNIYIPIKKEKSFFETKLQRKISSNLLTLVNLIECSKEYFEYVEENLKIYTYLEKEDKFKMTVSSFNYLNKLSVNGINDNNKIEDIRYKINSITKRPSIVAKKNYFSLSKKDDSRSSITSRYENGIILEIDFQAYHFQLLDLYLGLFTNKSKNFNYHLEYFKISHNIKDKETLTVEEKDLIKKKIFYALYNIDIVNNSDNEIIQKLNLFKANILEFYKENNFIKSIYSTGNIYFDENVTYNKVVNYAIQDLETTINLKLLRTFYKHFQNKYNLILYVYDSFLFDIEEKNLDEFISNINKLFNNFIFSIKIGKSYDNLKIID